MGGRMHELWERYYFDSDAVIFVWKTPVEANEEDARKETELQQSLLEEVRSSIPDDVPFLVLGHIFAEKRNPTGVGSAPPSGNTTESNLTMPASNISPLSAASSPKTDVMYSTARLLPHYHNPLQALFFVNAANGQGVKSAIDWLVPMAKRQLKVRESRPVEEIDDVNKK
uniref:Uncharacterized protein n=1 Tax=Entomoneis paludosa TaxID=265537 RepID=A0A7S2YKZ3_9STRA